MVLYSEQVLQRNEPSPRTSSSNGDSRKDSMDSFDMELLRPSPGERDFDVMSGIIRTVPFRVLSSDEESIHGVTPKTSRETLFGKPFLSHVNLHPWRNNAKMNAKQVTRSSKDIFPSHSCNSFKKDAKQSTRGNISSPQNVDSRALTHPLSYDGGIKPAFARQIDHTDVYSTSTVTHSSLEMKASKQEGSSKNKINSTTSSEEIQSVQSPCSNVRASPVSNPDINRFENFGNLPADCMTKAIGSSIEHSNRHGSASSGYNVSRDASESHPEPFQCSENEQSFNENAHPKTAKLCSAVSNTEINSPVRASFHDVLLRVREADQAAIENTSKCSLQNSTPSFDGNPRKDTEKCDISDVDFEIQNHVSSKLSLWQLFRQIFSFCCYRAPNHTTDGKERPISVTG